MQAFRFRLERVLGWYGQQADSEQAKLAVCLNHLNDIDEKIHRLQIEQTEVEQNTILGGSIAGQDLSALGLYRLAIKRRHLEMNVERVRAEEAMTAQRERTRLAKQRFRLMENLRQRRLTAHTQAFDKELEEVAAEAFLARWTPPELGRTANPQIPARPRQLVDTVNDAVSNAVA